MSMKLKRAFAATALLWVGAACSPLEVCYNDSACATHERCFKGEDENSVDEGICLAPSCEPLCQSSAKCVWDTIAWEARCVASF
jgi:hypothetical protein